MTSWDEARRIAHGAGRPLPAEQVALDAAAGRVLAADLEALTALPSFDTAAMDGWAVRGAGPWTEVGQVLAGDPPFRDLRDGEAVEIATGAVVPVGCEGVVPYELGPLALAAHPAGRHVRATGQECEHGEVLLKAATVLSPAAVGLAAAVGVEALAVRRQARVACFVTGSELLSSGLPRDGRIRDAVGPMLRAVLGPEATVRHLLDDRAALLAALSTSEADVIITSGASSAGPADHLSSVLAELGCELLVDGVDVKPGHPQLLARLPGGPVVVGLPGNPLAALVGLVTLLAPLLAGLQGRDLPELASALLTEDIQPATGSHRLVPVLLREGRAHPTGHGGSAMLRGAAAAEAFAVLAPGVAGRAGDQVRLVALPG